MLGKYIRRLGPKGYFFILIFVAIILWSSSILGTQFNTVPLASNLKKAVVRVGGHSLRNMSRSDDVNMDDIDDDKMAVLDMRRSMSVMMENILGRLDKLEQHQAASYMNKPYGDRRFQANNTEVLFGNERTRCFLREEEMKSYSNCLMKAWWMQSNWESDPCYKTYGVDGTLCSIIIYLSEVEGWCPRSVWKGPTDDTADIFRQKKAVVTTDMAPLVKLLADPNARHSFAWIRTRINRLWPRWTAAIKSLAQKQDLTQRKQQKILVHLGLLTNRSGWGFAENQFKGGPLGELVQWSDLIAGLYILGHELTITSEAEQLASIIAKLPTATSVCQNRKDLPVHMIYTDIVGLYQFRDSVKQGYAKFSCLLRIVDSFGTEPAFNLRSYVDAHNLSTFWGGQDLNPQQFNTMFPHSPDNSFMGFVVERHSSPANQSKATKKNMAVVYGKNDYMWKGKKAYLDQLHDAGLDIHGTVHMQKGDVPQHIPDYVINHGLLHGADLHKLLRSSKIFVGMGFPFEGPAPLEAIANGAVYLNPQFNTPKGRKTDPFFGGKPTERELTSQHPYPEQFVGEPFVYTLDINNTLEVKRIVKKILTDDKFEEYMPYEYTEEGFLQRMNAYIEHQNFCEFQKRLAKWPPEKTINLVFGAKGQSCKDVCWEKNLICEPTHFLEANTHAALIKNGAHCSSNITQVDIYYPALNVDTNVCITQAEQLLFSCVGSSRNLRRLCPCRTYIKGQTALCQGCDV